MEHLFDSWPKLEGNFKDRVVFIFFDYDGTLTPIADTPAEATISQDVKNLLNKLSENPAFKLAIISGRSLIDIKNLIGLKNIIYVGNHGLEIEGEKIKFESQVSPRLKSIIRRLYENSVKKFSKIKGALVEDKGLSISVHYRLVDKNDMQEFMRILNESIEPYIVRGKIKINPGKKVYDIKPPVVWDKGKVALWLLAREQFSKGESEIFPVYIGDDVTDEDAFRALANKGLTVFVGEPDKTEAKFYLKDTSEVTEFIRRIAALRE